MQGLSLFGLSTLSLSLSLKAPGAVVMPNLQRQGQEICTPQPDQLHLKEKAPGKQKMLHRINIQKNQNFPLEFFSTGFYVPAQSLRPLKFSCFWEGCKNEHRGTKYHAKVSVSGRTALSLYCLLFLSVQEIICSFNVRLTELSTSGSLAAATMLHRFFCTEITLNQQ